MRNRIIRTIAYVLISAFACTALSGCSMVPSLDITDEQRTLIAEYAAGKLIEYVKGHPGGLVKVDDIDYSQVNPGMKKEEDVAQSLLPGQTDETQESSPTQQAEQTEPAADEVSADDIDTAVQDALVDSPDVTEVPTKTPTQALGIDGAELAYDHYEISNTYPENAEELALSMKAASGKELLVVHFALSNPGSEDVIVHTDSNNFKVRMMLNGSEKLRGDITFLDNDLMNYEGLLTPGSSVDTVLVFEMPEGTDITSLDLIIVDDEGEQTYTLI